MTQDWIGLLGLDPGLAHLGYAVVLLRPTGPPKLAIDNKGQPVFGYVETEKSAKKLNVMASSDNLRRAREVVRPLLDLVDMYEGKRSFFDFASSFRIRAICAESMSFPRNASASQKLGISWGVIATISEIYGLPVAEVTPQQMKKALCGKRDASKPEIQAAVAPLYGIPADMFGVTVREHPYDALAAIHATLDSEVVRMARRLIK